LDYAAVDSTKEVDLIPSNTGIDEMFMKPNCLICDGIHPAMRCVAKI